MSAPNANLTQANLLVSSSNPTGHVLLSDGKRFNVQAQKDLKLGQGQFIRRARHSTDSKAQLAWDENTDWEMDSNGLVGPLEPRLPLS
jgi:hypothetical protein